MISAVEFEELKQMVRDELWSFKLELKEALNPRLTNKRLSAKEAADYLNISLSTLYKKVSQIPHKKFGKKLIFNSKELENLELH